MKVFISHGIAHDDAPGNALLDRLYAALDRAADNLDPFLDRLRLAPGYLWRNALHTELARCGAGIIVLSARSVTRDWVKKEAAILSWRRALEVDPAFRLHVIVLDELGEADLEREGLGPMQLTEIQALRCDGSDAAIARVVDAARDDLLALARSVARRADWTPLDWLRDYLAARLAKDLTAAQLQALAGDMDDSADAAPPPLANAATAAAEAIACALLRNAFGKTTNLTGLMKRLDMLAVQREYRREIFDAVSALWVDPQCAAAFHPRLDPKRRGRSAYIALLQPGAGAPLFEARMLAQRANPEGKRAHVVSVAKPKDPNRLTRAVADELAAQFAATLREVLDEDDDEVDGEGDARENHGALLRQLARLAAPIYVVMKFPLDEQQLEELFTTLPGFIYVGPDAERPAGFSEFQWRRVSGWRQPDELSARKDEHANIKTQYGF